MEKEKKDDELVIIRVRRDLRKRLSNLAKKKETTITSLSNLAIKKFLNTEEYTFQDLMRVIDKISTIKLHREMIMKELSECHNLECKDIIEIIKDKKAFLFEEKLEDIIKKIESLKKSKLSGLFIHFSMKKLDVNQLNEVMNKIGDIFEEIEMDIRARAKISKEDKILLFVAYDKKEEGEDSGKKV